MALKTKASIAASRAKNNAAITAANTKAGATVAQQNSANASALASMNAVRTSQGLAPQTAIGEQAPGRTAGALSIDQSTNEIKDASGAVVGKGSSLNDALAKQTQLSSGAAPTVAGRPDLFAVAPGANQEVKSFFDPYTQDGKFGAGTGTMVNPKTATAEQMTQVQNGSLESFNKAQGLTYLDGATFSELQKDLNESDLIRDQSGRIFLRQGLTADQVRARAATSVTGTSTGVTGGTTASEFTVDVPDTITTETITDMMETPVTETDFNNMLAGIQVKQAELLALMTPGADEQATKAQIVDIKAQVEKSLTELSMGLNNVEDQPIAMQFITGQQASIQRSAEAKLQNLARIEANLLNELGLEQEARAVKASVAQTQLGYLQTNLDTAFKVKQMIQQEEDSIFNRARALKQDSQATFATILDTMKGADETDMSADQQKQLQDMAIAAGIPYSLVVAGLSNVKKQIAAGYALDYAKLDATDDSTTVSSLSTVGDVYNMDTVADRTAISEAATIAGMTTAAFLALPLDEGNKYLYPNEDEKEKNDAITYFRNNIDVGLSAGKEVSLILEEVRANAIKEGDSIEVVNAAIEYLKEKGKERDATDFWKIGDYVGDDPDFSNVGGDTKKATDSSVRSTTPLSSAPLDIAKTYLGMNAGNPKQARTLGAFFKKAGGISLDPATTAWCAAFANSVLGAAGIKGTGSAMAQSFLSFGTAVNKPTKGDIVVFERGAKGSGLGHVGFVVGINKNGTLQVLGGNQSNRTSIETFKTSRVLGYRRINQTSVPSAGLS